MREQEEEIITLPPFSFFAYDWNEVLEYADGRIFRMNGDIDLVYRDIRTLGGLVEVDGNLNLRGSNNLLTLGKLKRVSGFLNLRYCTNLESLGELETVNGKLDLTECISLVSLDNLKYVGKDLDLRDCFSVTFFNELKYVGGDLDIENTTILKLMTDDEILNRVEIKGNIFRV